MAWLGAAHARVLRAHGWRAAHPLRRAHARRAVLRTTHARRWRRSAHPRRRSAHPGRLALLRIASGRGLRLRIASGRGLRRRIASGRGLRRRIASGRGLRRRIASATPAHRRLPAVASGSGRWPTCGWPAVASGAGRTPRRRSVPSARRGRWSGSRRCRRGCRRLPGRSPAAGPGGRAARHGCWTRRRRRCPHRHHRLGWPRRGPGRRCAVHGHQLKRGLSDLKPLTGFHREVGEALAVEPGAVGAASVPNPDLSALKNDLRMSTRGLGVVEHDVTRLSADRGGRSTDVARLGRAIDVLDLENVVATHSFLRGVGASFATGTDRRKADPPRATARTCVLGGTHGPSTCCTTRWARAPHPRP